ncbi:kinesin-like protein KIN-8A [Tanacetum coccineum]
MENRSEKRGNREDAENGRVMVRYGVKDESNNVLNRIRKLSLIDLAGSERAIATDQRTLRSLEGANINRSLLALISCWENRL